MNKTQKNNPLHGITLQQLLESLVEHYGWEELGKRVDIKSIKRGRSGLI